MTDRTVAERQRRFRARRCQGVVKRIHLDVTQAVVNFMVDELWIEPSDLKNAGTLENAVADLLECLAEGRLVRRYAALHTSQSLDES